MVLGRSRLLGDIQKVRSVKIPRFWPPPPSCSPLFVFRHPPSLQGKFVLAITDPLTLNFYICEIYRKDIDNEY